MANQYCQKDYASFGPEFPTVHDLFMHAELNVRERCLCANDTVVYRPVQSSCKVYTVADLEILRRGFSLTKRPVQLELKRAKKRSSPAL